RRWAGCVRAASTDRPRHPPHARDRRDPLAPHRATATQPRPPASPPLATVPGRPPPEWIDCWLAAPTGPPEVEWTVSVGGGSGPDAAGLARCNRSCGVAQRHGAFARRTENW